MRFSRQNSFENVVARRFLFVLLTALLALGMVACGETDADENGDEQVVGIAVSGTWDTNFGTVEEITDAKWDYAAVVKYDNAARVAITQNPEDDEFGPSLFNKLVWTEIAEDSFYYCMITYGQETQVDAENTVKVADESKLDTDGCDGFSWTKMTRK